jgi:hypothetical protein
MDLRTSQYDSSLGYKATLQDSDKLYRTVVKIKRNPDSIMQ